MQNYIFVITGLVMILCIGKPIPSNAEEQLEEGEYRIQHKLNNRYLDAFGHGDYKLVTRNEQTDDSQIWILTRVPGTTNTYTIQQKANNRFVDAYGTNSREQWVVTRPAQGDDSQKWTFTRVPGTTNTYTIQQKANDRYLDAHGTKSSDTWAVTRPAQGDDSQKWILTNLDKFDFVRIEYLIDEAKIASATPITIASQCLKNRDKREKEMLFRVSRTLRETSSFDYMTGFEVTVGTTFETGVPVVSQGKVSASLTSTNQWTWGKEVSKETTHEGEFPLNVKGGMEIIARAKMTESKVDVPYVMYFKSQRTGNLKESRGVWNSVSHWGLTYSIDRSAKVTPGDSCPGL